MVISMAVRAEESGQVQRKRADWYQHFDERLTYLEGQLSTDLEKVHKKQEILNKEMIRLNEKLENRFDKYFLWGYGTLLVVISTLVNVVFNRRKQEDKKLQLEENEG